MTYTSPVSEMKFVLQDLCGLDDITALPGFEHVSPDLVSAIFDGAAKYADNILSPLNRIGDRQGASFSDGAVHTAKGWVDAYEVLVEMGWNSPSSQEKHGGMGLPNVINACIQEMFQGANMAFQLCPMLTQGAIEALTRYGAKDLKADYLPKLVSGEWTGTMNLTEPQAGSDLAAIRTRAIPVGDHYLLSGHKIFVTYGEHDLTENIVHLVLARLPDAPVGVKGISLFVVPKYLGKPDGTLGAHNDLRCISIEHKLGIHGSPTCTLSFGDNGGAIGFLVGEPHRGIQYMFTMMNSARLNVGLQGIGVSEHACQDALTYAVDRRQGQLAGVKGSVPIIEHPDVRRMLALMQAQTRSARILACRAAQSLDYVQACPDEATRAWHQRRIDLLIPIVKGWSTDNAIDVTSLGVQVHGGMGYIEETGVAQHFRDARIAPIYEGTSGIQALDLVRRKILGDEGRAVAELIDDMRTTQKALDAANSTHGDWPLLRRSLKNAVDVLAQTTDWLLEVAAKDSNHTAAVATGALGIFGTTLGMWCMADAALASAARIERAEDTKSSQARIHLAEFYATQILPLAAAQHEALAGGSKSVLSMTPETLSAQ